MELKTELIMELKNVKPKDIRKLSVIYNIDPEVVELFDLYSDKNPKDITLRYNKDKKLWVKVGE